MKSQVNKATAERYVRERSYFTATCLVKASDLSSDLFPFFGNERVDGIPSPFKESSKRKRWPSRTCVCRKREGGEAAVPVCLLAPHDLSCITFD